jgi:hypothetical protein
MTDPLLLVAITLAALLAGLLVGWWLGARPLAAERTAREQAQRELAARTAAQEERDRAHAAELARLEAHFQQLAARALDDAQRKLAEGANQLLQGHREAATQGLEVNRAQMAELLQPMRDALVRYEQRLGEVEQARQESYGKLDEAVRGVVLGQEKVSGATVRLVHDVPHERRLHHLQPGHRRGQQHEVGRAPAVRAQPAQVLAQGGPAGCTCGGGRGRSVGGIGGDVEAPGAGGGDEHLVAAPGAPA